MNKLIKAFATLLLVCVATITFAQSPTLVRSFSNVKFLVDKLDLTDDQAKTIQTVLDDQNAQLKELRTSINEDNRDDLITDMNAIRAKSNKAIKSILTDEQNVIFDELLSQRNSLGALNPGKKGLNGQGNLIEKLSLDESQTTAYKAIMEDQAQQLKALRKDMQTDGDRAKLRSKISDIRNETAEKIKEILNEDQLAEYNKILENQNKRPK